MSRRRTVEKTTRIASSVVALAITCAFSALAHADSPSREFVLHRSFTQAAPGDTISREFTLLSFPMSPQPAGDAVSREFTLLSFPMSSGPVSDTVSREFTLLNDPEALGPVFDDAVSREFTLLREASPLVSSTDAVSRSFSLVTPQPDLRPLGITPPPNFSPGADVEISWTALNEGAGTARGSWVETVYASADASPGDDHLLAQLPYSDPIAPLQGILRTEVLTLPAGLPTGAYSTIVCVDTTLELAESDESNNCTVEPPCVDCAQPDLVVTDIQAPAEGFEGTRVSISWTVQNQGAETTIGSWTDHVFLSTDSAVGDDTLLASFAFANPVVARAEYSRTETVNLPSGQLGPHYIIVVTDAINTLSEPGAEGNNALVDDLPIDVLAEVEADLEVRDVLAPSAALADDEIVVQWTVTNVGGLPAPPSWLDTIYLDATEGDIPLGSLPRTQFLSSGQAYTASHVVTLPGRIEGTFGLYVQTDSLDDVPESGSPLNNVEFAPQPVTITQPPRPDLIVESVATPASGIAGAPFDTGFTIANVGAEEATGPWFDRIIAVDVGTSQETVLAEVTNVGPLGPAASYSANPSVDYPIVAGEYRLKIETDRTDAVNEGLSGGETANTALSVGTFTVEAYDVSVSADIESGVAGTPVVLSGQATLSGTGTPVPDAAVAIGVQLQGTTRILSEAPDGTSLRTDGAGMFVTTFQPLSNEAGLYGLTAGPPGQLSTTPQDTFVLYGMSVAPAVLNEDVTPDGPATIGQLTLRNLGDVPLTGLTVDVGSLPETIVVEVALESIDLAPLASTTANWTLFAGAGAAGEVSTTLLVTSLEGAAASANLDIEVRPPMPDLVLDGPSPLVATMLRSDPPPAPGEPQVPRQTLVEFRIRNAGGAATGPLGVALSPGTPWLRAATPESLPPLAPDATATVGLILTPDWDQILGDYTGQVVVADGSTGLAVPYRFTAVSERIASLLVIAEDEASYWAVPPQALAGADVVLRDPSTGSLVASGQTSAAGEILFEGLTEGRYDLEVSAEGHRTHESLVLVTAAVPDSGSKSVSSPSGNPAQPTEARVFLPMQTVTYSWNVVPTEIEDQYEFTLDPLFETNVPAPVVRVTPAFVDLDALTAEYTQIDFEVYNDGLITADDVTIGFTGNDRYEITALVAELGDLPAQARVTVPVVIHDREFGTAKSVQTVSNCDVRGEIEWSLVCGIPYFYVRPIEFNNPQECIHEISGLSEGGTSGTGAIGDPFSDGPVNDVGIKCCFETTLIEVDVSGVFSPIETAIETTVLAYTGGVFSAGVEIESKASMNTCCTEDEQLGLDFCAEASAEISVTPGLADNPSFSISFVDEDVPPTSFPEWLEISTAMDVQAEVSASLLAGLQVRASVQVAASVCSNCDSSDSGFEASGSVTLTAFAGFAGQASATLGVAAANVECTAEVEGSINSAAGFSFTYDEGGFAWDGCFDGLYFKQAVALTCEAVGYEAFSLTLVPPSKRYWVPCACINSETCPPPENETQRHWAGVQDNVERRVLEKLDELADRVKRELQ